MPELMQPKAVQRTEAAGRHFSSIVELRRYTLHPGRRDDLIDLFDTHFLESQEACGMTVIGQFRDPDDPDAFVWLRGFEDMATRYGALTAFYDGPVWSAHRDRANGTMIDSDNVLLLHPAESSSGFALPAARPASPTEAASPAVFQVVTYQLKRPADQGFRSYYSTSVAPLLQGRGDNPVAVFTSEHGENTFTRLPVRQNENVLAVFSRFDDESAHKTHRAALENDAAWLSEQTRLAAYLTGKPLMTRLLPTARSRLR